MVYGRKRWLEFLPPTLRPDNAQGFGPLPNTNLYARIFNNLCNAVNLLVRARIDLPMNFESRDGEVTWLGLETSADGTTTKAAGAEALIPMFMEVQRERRLWPG